VVEGWSFNPPPYWPQPPEDWTPAPDWRPDPSWGPIPPGWQLWVSDRPVHRRPAVVLAAGLGVVLVIAVAGAWIPRSDDVAPTATRTAPLRPALIPAQPGPAATVTPTATLAPTPIRTFRDCHQLNDVFPHGVGMPQAIDKTSGMPVTNFGRSSALYRANLTRDRDHDGISCEQR
jgi:Excalibur calcium-binding domain